MSLVILQGFTKDAVEGKSILFVENKAKNEIIPCHTRLQIIGGGIEGLADLRHQTRGKISQRPMIVQLWTHAQLLGNYAGGHRRYQLVQLSGKKQKIIQKLFEKLFFGQCNLHISPDTAKDCPAAP